MRIRVVDAFTDQAFAGNPAGVCLLAAGDWPDETWMRAVTAELRHSETAFARPSEQPDVDWDLRWFTPVVEENLCGHATLATVHSMVAEGLVGEDGKVRFSSRSGVLIAEVGADGWITLDFPIAELTERPAPDGLVAALGVVPEAVLGTGGLRDLLVVLPDEQTVRGLAPDFDGLTELTEREDLRGVVPTAPAADGAEYDFVSRFFSPGDGLPEDPVTGSAHTALAPYWAKRLGRDDLVGYQASARGGLVRAVPAGDRVYLTGRVVTVLDGDLLV
ncbi:PhzF family phenazine biosynthesis protein [Kribbella voronezhensis]|uniref:PhzF family phenazine biosynthesis protein n=1 Tax=Kribbella voronezhensis TaxID=2512212 RepID=A0A4R7TDH2_9ACTN|nr:PhzF family phenazine biosynthesis protein [Kribbella voronezhensis]TDU90191.1 PhzF family phenazine biosynthesis protein [Kribbella voronezhensis]